MSEVVLGQNPKALAQRDAVHVAVVPCRAADALQPGQHVDVVNGVATTDGKRRIGIVDPFLKKEVEKGQFCYVCLYPGSIVGMRHHWRHPAFVESSDRESALTVLESIAKRIGVGFEELLEDADNFLRYGDYRSEGARFEGVYLGDDFWDAYEIVRECAVKGEDRGGVYSCSC